MLNYGIVGNCKTSALISNQGSVDWMCFPTFSDPSIFAKILDEKKGGSLQIIPQGKYQITQRYIPNTAILETTFTSTQVIFQVIDFLPRYRKLLSKQHERLVKRNKLIRLIKPIKGIPKIKILYNPRPNYAKQTCNLKEKTGNIICTDPMQQVGLLSNIPGQEIIRKKTIELKQCKYLVVGKIDDPDAYNVKVCEQLLRSTKKYWERWVTSLVLPNINQAAIIRSAITLKLLTYSETGAIIAASTTSIPEEIGSNRTWDYRYCWVRDSVFCVDALKKIGRGWEAKKLMNFIINLATRDDFIQIMYGINGETKLKEEILPHLSGFQGSKPVRIGNAAYNQLQHDIFGEILDLLYIYFIYYGYEKKISKKYWRFVAYVVNQIKFNWHKKDSGIWEFRGQYQHYTYSKFMSYVGVDRAIKLAQHFKREDLVSKWIDLRDEIFEDIIHHGYNKKAKAFTIHYDSSQLDASLLLMAYHEFLPPNDPRLINTITAIYKKLRKNHLVQRYTIQDDFGKSTSAFTVCSFWLVDALYYIGEEKKARKMYQQLMNHGNHLGLFSEDIDLKSKQLTGNFPQAYTHIAIINSSILLSEWSSKRKKIDRNQISSQG